MKTSPEQESQGNCIDPHACPHYKWWVVARDSKGYEWSTLFFDTKEEAKKVAAISNKDSVPKDPSNPHVYRAALQNPSGYTPAEVKNYRTANEY